MSPVPPSDPTVNELFGSCETIEDAVEYAQNLINTLPLEHRMTALTAYWVVLNTALAKIEKLNPHNVGPVPLTDLPEEIKLADISQDQLAIMIRTLLAPTLSKLHQLSDIPIFGNCVKSSTSFVAIVGQYFGVSHDELIAEIEAYRAA